ncbi:STAS domain-containing protein [Nonomuraea sediminis]|uniref:STAS domain-containing protein n=1 Tax=Nonomuraea sediminis TaxID=2835864 RepID=UPI001BDCDDAE|nr:STAS domain-containing protein [Nonomuraea sediminis]
MTAIDTTPLGGTGPPAPTVVRLSGQIDIFTTRALRQRLLNTLSYSTSLLVLDMSQVTFFDAGGLGILVGLQNRAKARGISLALTGLTPFMTRLLRISNLDRRFPIAA